MVSKPRRREYARREKISQTLHEFKQGQLHSGSKQGPAVEDPKQAIAIALSQARKKA